MSLPEYSTQSSLFGVFNLLTGQFGSDDRFRLFSEKIQPLLAATRPVLASCYCAENGRPAAEPVLLLGISVLQFMERLPDRAAMEMVKYHLGWKLALGCELDLSAPDPSTLSYFRQRLLEHDQAKLAFDTVLEGLRAAGLVAKRSKQRLDSTHVLGSVARLSSLECCREALRLALQEVAEVELAWPQFGDLLWERYVQSKLDYRLEEAAVTEKYLEAGRDMARLVGWAEQQQSEGVEVCGQAMQVLRRVLAEQFEVVEGEPRKRVRSGGSVQNPHDPEAQWSTKGKTGKAGWVGYKAQVAETLAEGKLEEGEPTRSFVTAVETQAATGSEPAGMQQVLESQKQSGLEPPPELYVDSGYVSAEKLKEAAEQGRELVGPALGSSHQPQGFRTEDFDVRVEKRTAVCPGKMANSGCTRKVDKNTGEVFYRFEWNGCASCALRQQCLGPNKRRRELEVGEHHGYLQERRREQKTEAFERRMHQRNGIEGTISELTRGHGMRRSRYRGLEKTRQQNYFIGAACNVKRWLRHAVWEMGQQAKRLLGVASASVGAGPAATVVT